MMTSNGAAGETKSAMRTTLHLDGYGDEEVNAYYKKLKEALLKTDPSTKLSIANAIFTNQLVNIHKAFIQTNQSYFDATIQKVNFGDPATVGIINGWAEEHTNGLIKKVIERTQSLDLMYLLNAIYFKGIWTTQFDKKDTSRKPFTHEDGERANVDMMHQTATFNYTEDRTFQLIQLPYGNQAFSMMVLLPVEGISLGEAVTVLSGDGYWSGLQSMLSGAEVVLSLPKFKTEYSKKLNDVLTTMGMGIAFSDMADFSGMSDYNAKISFVKQDTYISTDEEGTEAAAVTTVGIEVTALPSPRKVIFNANRPFLYLIQENSTGAILFMGVVKHFK
jgi:serpin B